MSEQEEKEDTFVTLSKYLMLALILLAVFAYKEELLNRPEEGMIRICHDYPEDSDYAKMYKKILETGSYQGQLETGVPLNETTTRIITEKILNRSDNRDSRR